MMRKPMMVALAMGVLFATACEDKPAETAKPADAPAKAEPAKAEPTAAATAEPAPAPKNPKWEIQVEGHPKLAGGMIMKSKIGKIEKYSLVGANAMVSFDLETDDAPEPYLAMVGFNESQTACAKPLSGKPINEVLLSRSGDKHIVSGQINCRTKDGQKAMKKISGWFEHK